MSAPLRGPGSGGTHNLLAWTSDPRIVSRFWKHVIPEPNTGCDIWMGSGRGVLDHGGFAISKAVTVYAHRFAYALEHGVDPGAASVCHNCPSGDLPRCVNPRHLFLGTHLENVRDCIAKGRNAHGERGTGAKFSEIAARSYLARYAAGEGVESIAREAAVTTQCIRGLVLGTRWAHLGPRDEIQRQHRAAARRARLALTASATLEAP